MPFLWLKPQLQAPELLGGCVLVCIKKAKKIHPFFAPHTLPLSFASHGREQERASITAQYH